MAGDFLSEVVNMFNSREVATPIPLEAYQEIPIQDGIVAFHVAPYFLVYKDEEESRHILQSIGLEALPEHVPGEIGSLFWEKQIADEDGHFTIPSNRLVLAHTAESVLIQADRRMYIANQFCLQSDGQPVWYSTHCGAAVFYPGSRGPQTYEIHHIYPVDLTVNVNDFVCYAFVKPHDTPSALAEEKLNGVPNGRMSTQKRGLINFSNWDTDIIEGPWNSKNYPVSFSMFQKIASVDPTSLSHFHFELLWRGRDNLYNNIHV